MRQINTSQKIAAFLLVFFTVNACTKDFQDLNTSPDLATKDNIQPDLLLTYAQRGAIFGIHGAGIPWEYAGYYSNQASGVILQNRDWASPFLGYYRSYLINISEVIRLTAGDPILRNENAIARIWKVWLFHRLTDAYGDIPYFQATQAVEEVIYQPEYDSQEAIYQDMLKELKEAAEQLTDDPDLASYEGADLLYNGDVESWKRFANSLRLRLAMRVRYADERLAGQHIGEVVSAPLMEGNDHNASLTTEGEDAENTDNRNSVYNRYQTTTIPMWASFTTTENLLKRNDPRLPIYALPAVDGTAGYRGRPIALFGDEKLPYGQEETARLGELFYQAEYTIQVMNAAEVYFLRAEAALAGFSSENAETLFRQGIQLSMELYNVDPADINTYLESEAATLSGTPEEQLEEIIVQKWLANYYQAYEAWAEYRRTGYPLIWVGSDKGDTNGEIPRRFTYPQDEYAKNGANVSEAVSRLTEGDNLMSKIWWDAKPGLPFHHPRQGMFPPEME